MALRTVGLLVLMNQSGLHVPVADGSALPVFRDVLADIGDEQSVAQSLSTFSGHLRTITRIVDAAGEGTLVLLDELGAGTDPTEGSALAQSLLDHFIRVGALVVATTHYAELKTYAHNEPRARNASVDFDLATLAPTFHLSIGLPGTSQAFAIAERLGLPAALVEDARARLSVAQQEFETTLASIRRTQLDITAAEARTADAEQRARAALAEAEEERRRARAERRVAAAEARRQAEVALAADRGRDRRDARRAGARDPHRGAPRPGHGAHRRATGASCPRVESEVDAGTPAAVRSWQVGSACRNLERLAGHAGGGWTQARRRATLDVSGMRLEVALDELPGGLRERASPGAAARRARRLASHAGGGGSSGSRHAPQPRPRPAAPAARRSAARVPAPSPPAWTCAAPGWRRHWRCSSSTSTTRRSADAGRVTIIHGHGSGAMRDAVRSALGEHPLVREWRPGERGEGGDGATIVSL